MNGIPNGLLVVLLGGLGLTLAVAIHRQNVAAAVNALVASLLALLSLPLTAGLRSPWSGAVLAPELPLWVTVAGLLHSVGMLGPYDSIRWWDHLTHTVSAALVAALLYAGVIVAADGTGLLASTGTAVTTVVYTFAVGVFWELLELAARAVAERYDIEPVLVHYGWRDTALDLGFDLLGAVLVVAFDVRVFVAFAARSPEATRTLLEWTGGVLTVGSALMVLFLGASETRGVRDG